jgi:D-xylono/L-arabinono-1,4-lactonase
MNATDRLGDMVGPELVADCRCQLGENPLWHPMERLLYWTDIASGKLFRYDPADGSHEECYRGAPVGGFTIQADGALLCFMEGGAIGRWHEGRLTYMVKEIPVEAGHRFNDVIADPYGRVFCGTLPTLSGAPPGRLYRLDTDGSLHVILEGVGLSNGMAFTLDHRHMYYTDSIRRHIYLFAYDEKTGDLSNPSLWLCTPAGAGLPDGMTVDSCGYVWSARWGGSALYRYTPDGTESERVAFPANKVSSVTFGGDDLGDIYVTTALAGGTRDEEGAGGGALFRLRVGVQGLPEFYSRVLL